MRPGCHNRVTFHQWYAYDDKWVLPLSHDEVVHGKKSLLDKMPGDWWQRRAQLRLLFGYQVAVPGRPLLFQGAEFGQGREWDWDRRVDWDEAAGARRAAASPTSCAPRCASTAASRALHVRDDHRDGFQWVDCEKPPRACSPSCARRPGAPGRAGRLQLHPDAAPRLSARACTTRGRWTRLLDSDDARFGGSGVVGPERSPTHDDQRGIFPVTLRIELPPLGIVFLRATDGALIQGRDGLLDHPARRRVRDKSRQPGSGTQKCVFSQAGFHDADHVWVAGEQH